MKTSYRLAVLAGLVVVWGAGAEIGPKVVPPSERNHSVEAIRESGERGGLLLHVGTSFTPADNRRMGEAMELWNAHRWTEARAAFNAIWTRHPESPWAAEAELHEACFCKFAGLYDEAEERFVSLLAKYPNHPEVKNKVLRYLPDLYAKTGRLADAYDALQCLLDTPLTWRERTFIESYSRVYGRALSSDQTERRCGAKALALALVAAERGSLRNVPVASALKKYEWAERKAGHDDGFSLADLAQLGGGKALELTLAELRSMIESTAPVLVHLKTPGPAQCWDTLRKPGNRPAAAYTGHYVVVDRVSDVFVDMVDPGGGRFRMPLRQFVYRWSGAVLAVGKQMAFPGREVGPQQASTMRGGCCGQPPPDITGECTGGKGGGSGGPQIEYPPPFDRATSSTTSESSAGGGPQPMANCPSCRGGKPGGAGGGCCSPRGAPGYRFGMASANFSLDDVPMWYSDAKGPAAYIQLTYNRLATERMAQYTNANFFPFGRKWHFNFASFLSETPRQDGASSEIVLPHGRAVSFESADGVQYEAVDIWNEDALLKTNQSFLLTFQESGERWFFSANTDNQQRLERLEDKYGNAITLEYAPSGRLTNIVDAIGRYFALYYNDAGMVTNITDCIGRSTIFSYNAAEDLVSMTDMGGLITEIHYDTNHWPTNIVYPNLQAWRVAYDEGGFGFLTGPFRVTVTDPIGQQHVYAWTGFLPNAAGVITDPAGNSRSQGFDNELLNNNTTRATIDLVNAPASGMNGHLWINSTFDSDANAVEIKVPASQIVVTPEDLDGQSTFFSELILTNVFDDRHNLLSSTVLTNDIFNGLVQIGTWTNWYDARDNRLGARNPLNQTTRFGYDTYNNLTAVTNALNQFTLLTYDHNGNLTNLVDALLRTNRWVYDANGREVESIAPDGVRVTKGYDFIGRQTALTNHGSGLYLQYTHDNLDRLRDTIFPDGTSNHWEYNCCGLEWTRNRLNDVTTFVNDALGRTTRVTDPEGRETEFRYNGANQITNLITWVGGQPRVKEFEHTSTNGFSRLTKVKTPMGKLTRYDYTFRGGLAWREDGNGRVTKFQYDPLLRLVSVSDAQDNALVRMDYDVLGNMTYVSNAHSVFEYTYDGLNRATQAVCLLTNMPGFSTVKYRIAYSFDPVGNVTNRAITGLQGFTDTILTVYGYDVMNRLTNVVQLTNGAATASAWYSYDSAGRLWKKGYGNGDVVTHGYDTESRLLSMGITNASTPVLWYAYQWDAIGNITAITNNGTNITLYGYDRAGQLTNEVLFTNGLAGFTTNAWQYDEAGNWLHSPGENRWRLYNPDNELAGICGSNAPVSVTTTVTGHVEPGPGSNKWFNTWATVRGQTARVGTNTGDFTITNVPVYAGDNDLQVTVRDVSGNTATQTRSVSRPMDETFRYDGNGNLTNWVSGTTNWVYEWDWADRLTKVSSNGITVLENWYDAGSRRIAFIENLASNSGRRMCCWDSRGLALDLDESGGMTTAYLWGIGHEPQIPVCVALSTLPEASVCYLHSDHQGSIRKLRQGGGSSSARDYSPFGEPRGWSSANYGPCRLGFCSKEISAPTGLIYYGYRFYVPHLGRWPNRDPIGEAGGGNLFQFVGNNPVTSIDADGLRSIIYGTGKLCMGQNCDSDKCGQIKYLDEDNWGKGWLDAPAGGGCVEADAVAFADGILKIPDNCRITIQCGPSGAPNGKYKQTCYGLIRRPVWNPPGFPPNPFLN